MVFTFEKNLNRVVLLGEVLPGISRIGNILATDIQKVFGGKVNVIEGAFISDTKENDIVVSIDNSSFNGEYQVYSLKVVDRRLYVTGADLLGAIYGMFHVSELIGVSPMVYFGDAEPAKRKDLTIPELEYRAKQPSVKYRGFFINDEWPAFGTWMSQKFGAANAKCYEVIFEFLLRMKGNFLWPAMWASSFPCEGPGTLNEELATELGITVSYSHHEPCLRASEEWKHVCGENSPYGSVWNFDKNEQGLLNYWRDSLVRSGKFNHLITIGMRGEYDSIMLENATLADNIEALKKIIRAQRKLINELNIQLPLTLAIYKEVEQYFYGDENTPGLMEWDELKDVILMLCEDNHGHMRGLPTKKMREHKGGYGMYFHLDYHGGPVSYEWVNSTSFYQVWEEMTEAYDFGINDVWVVNVGDIKFNELPLYYFLQIAYDYDKWGSSNMSSPDMFTRNLMKQMFPLESEKTISDLSNLLKDAYQLNSERRPETVHSGVFSVCCRLENDKLINTINDMVERAKALYKAISSESRDCFYSTIYWPLIASANLYLMWLYSDKNIHYGKQGKAIARKYADLTRECIEYDKTLAREFGKFAKGKWNGMQLEAHTGFTTWNDFDMRLPLVCDFTPVEKPSLKVSFANSPEVYVKVYGRPMRMTVSKPDTLLEIANSGLGEVEYSIISKEKGEKVFGKKTQEQDLLRVSVKEWDKASHIYQIAGNDGTVVEVETVGFEALFTEISRGEIGNARSILAEDAITLKASDYDALTPGSTGEWKLLKGYGKYDEGLKVLGRIDDYEEKETAPSVTWEFEADNFGNRPIEIITAPTNPLKFGGALNLKVKVNDKPEFVLNLVPKDFKAGENSDPRWCRDVIAQERRTLFLEDIKEGKNSITITACEVGVIVERIVIYDSEDSYRRNSKR